jgi:hypothetical protein
MRCRSCRQPCRQPPPLLSCRCFPLALALATPGRACLYLCLCLCLCLRRHHLRQRQCIRHGQRIRALSPCFSCQVGLLCGPCLPILFLALGPWCNLRNPPPMRCGSSLNGRREKALIECEDLTVDGKCGFFSTTSS